MRRTIEKDKQEGQTWRTNGKDKWEGQTWRTNVRQELYKDKEDGKMLDHFEITNGKEK